MADSETELKCLIPVGVLSTTAADFPVIILCPLLVRTCMQSCGHIHMCTHMHTGTQLVSTYKHVGNWLLISSQVQLQHQIPHFAPHPSLSYANLLNQLSATHHLDSGSLILPSGAEMNETRFHSGFTKVVLSSW